MYPYFSQDDGDDDPRPPSGRWPMLIAALGVFWAMRAFEWSADGRVAQLLFWSIGWLVLGVGMFYFFVKAR